MILEIDDSKTIGEVIKEFNSHYPLLKLEFFLSKHEVGCGSKKRELINHTKNIGETRSKHNPGIVIIKEEMLVSDLEKLFWDTFGLSVQVFRKSGDVWLETTATDNWSLKKQNESAAYQD